MLAVAWGRVIQIISINKPYDGEVGITFDGFYISDNKIDSIFFITDSLLYILVKEKEARVLYIPSFNRGNFWEEGDKALKEDESEM